MTTYRLMVNGEHKSVTVDSSTTLLWVLREDLKMTGTKYGCGIGACGACHRTGGRERPLQTDRSALSKSGAGAARVIH